MSEAFRKVFGAYTAQAIRRSNGRHGILVCNDESCFAWATVMVDQRWHCVILVGGFVLFTVNSDRDFLSAVGEAVLANGELK